MILLYKATSDVYMPNGYSIGHSSLVGIDEDKIYSGTDVYNYDAKYMQYFQSTGGMCNSLHEYLSEYQKYLNLKYNLQAQKPELDDPNVKTLSIANGAVQIKITKYPI